MRNGPLIYPQNQQINSRLVLTFNYTQKIIRSRLSKKLWVSTALLLNSIKCGKPFDRVHTKRNYLTLNQVVTVVILYLNRVIGNLVEWSTFNYFQVLVVFLDVRFWYNLDARNSTTAGLHD